jgi:hypothetical protein
MDVPAQAPPDPGAVHLQQVRAPMLIAVARSRHHDQPLPQ